MKNKLSWRVRVRSAVTLAIALGAIVCLSNGAFQAQQKTANIITGPAFTDYRGIRIGMTTSEVRQKLGNPKVKDKAQDFYVFNDKESAQVYYEGEKVYAVSIDFIGSNEAPTVREVLNEDVAARADGSMYAMKQYPKVGYWVSYNRTTSNPPQVTITMQKIAN